MTKAMEEARAILKDINVHPITHAPRLLDRIATALAARDAEIERLREALREIIGSTGSMSYVGTVARKALARRALTAGGQP